MTDPLYISERELSRQAQFRDICEGLRQENRHDPLWGMDNWRIGHRRAMDEFDGELDAREEYHREE